MENIHQGHREKMRQRFLKSGLESFADHEALELLLYYAIPQGDVNGLAHELVERFGSLAGVLDAAPEELEKVTLGGLRRAVLEGDVEMGSVMSGQVAGMLHEIRPVAEIFRDLYESGIARAKATAAEWSDAE